MSSNRPLSPASYWLRTHESLIREASALGPVVDLACGRGRNAVHLAREGLPVVGFDRNADDLRELQVRAQREALPVHPVRCDLEKPHGAPLARESCGVILVFRFLFRPLTAAIVEALAPGGILLYETFELPHRDTGRGPRRRAFYLEPGELRTLFSDLEVVAHGEGPDGDTAPDITQRLCARKPRRA